MSLTSRIATANALRKKKIPKLAEATPRHKGGGGGQRELTQPLDGKTARLSIPAPADAQRVRERQARRAARRQKKAQEANK